MPDAEILFQRIRARLIAAHEWVEDGKMMSSPAVIYRGKVFAFYHQQEMIFRLGKDFDPAAQGIDHWEWLNPFKNKPPMTAWFRIPLAHEDRRDALAQQALTVMADEMGGK